jgi:hypothetical protein
LQVFRLSNPPRIVIDFADPESSRLSSASVPSLDSSSGAAEEQVSAVAPILGGSPGEVQALQSDLVEAAVFDRANRAEAWSGSTPWQSAGALLFSAVGLLAAWRCVVASRDLRATPAARTAPVNPEDLLSPGERLELAERRS